MQDSISTVSTSKGVDVTGNIDNNEPVEALELLQQLYDEPSIDNNKDSESDADLTGDLSDERENDTPLNSTIPDDDSPILEEEELVLEIGIDPNLDILLY